MDERKEMSAIISQISMDLCILDVYVDLPSFEKMRPILFTIAEEIQMRATRITELLFISQNLSSTISRYPLMKTPEVAKLLCMKPYQVANMRTSRKGPMFIQVSKFHLSYRREDVEDWMETEGMKTRSVDAVDGVAASDHGPQATEHSGLKGRNMMDAKTKKALGKSLGSEFPVLTTNEVAPRMGIIPSTLDIKRGRGEGPLFRKVGNRVVYLEEDVLAYFENNKPRRSTSDEPEPVADSWCG